MADTMKFKDLPVDTLFRLKSVDIVFPAGVIFQKYDDTTFVLSRSTELSPEQTVEPLGSLVDEDELRREADETTHPV